MKALSVAEVLQLPAMANAKQAFAAIGVSEYTGYELVRNDEFPIEPVRIGRAIKFRRTSILALLGLEDDNGAGGATPAPSVEPPESTSRQTGAL
ncbi:helix-turn-helix domain-containing protein [Streptomyces decoyicus]|uniref:helix-turn-helix transcriptional regulator n=1 Tax=Streptomyces decoyicus TaxID=249567 RepID=UPI002E18DD58